MKLFHNKFFITILISSQILLITPYWAIETKAADTTSISNDIQPDSGDAGIEWINQSTVDEKMDLEPFELGNDYSEPDLATSNTETGLDKTVTPLSPSKIAAKFNTQKIILNPLDKMKLQQTLTANSVIPDFYNNLTELAAQSGKSVDELTSLKTSNYEQFAAIAKTATDATQNNDYIKARLIANPNKLAELFQTNVGNIVDKLQNGETNMLYTQIDLILANQIDKRVIKTLIYLVTPKDQGGAGHYRIRVSRITQNYDRKQTEGEKEDTVIRQEQLAATSSADTTTIEQLRADPTLTQQTQVLAQNSQAVVDIVDAAGTAVSSAFIGGSTLPADTVSAHASGQAVDISEIDDIKCTEIQKKRIGSDKKTAMPPTPVKLAWQTQAGYDADSSAINSSFNSMFTGMSQDAILEMLSGLNIDFTKLDNMSTANFSDIAKVIGQAFFANAVSSPSGDIWKFKLSEILRKLGGVVIADKLKLDRAPFLDTKVNDVDKLSESVGRYSIEKALNLPYGSLVGSSRDEILASIGRERMASELKLPAGSFGSATTKFADQNDMYAYAGSRILEDEFGFPAGAFYKKNSLAELQAATGKYQFQAFLMYPSQVDVQLGLADGTTAQFKSGALSPTAFAMAVFQSHLVNVVAPYGNVASSGNSTNVPTLSTAMGQMVNWRDDMFNFPKGTIDSVLFKQLTDIERGNVFKYAGIYALASTFENNDTNRARLTSWLTAPNAAMTVTVDVPDPNNPNATIQQNVQLATGSYAAAIGISQADFYSIFAVGTGADGIYKRIGKGLITKAVQNTSYVQDLKDQITSNLPSTNKTIAQIQFYVTRIVNISNAANDFRTRADDLLKAIDAAPTEMIPQTVKDAFRKDLLSMQDSVGKADSGSNNVDQFLLIAQAVMGSSDIVSGDITNVQGLVNSTLSDLQNKINALRYTSETIAKNAYEIITGVEQPDFRFEDMHVKSINASIGIDIGNATISGTDIAMFLAGKITPSVFFLNIGSAMLGSQLNIPPRALSYAAKVIDIVSQGDIQVKDAFYRAFGIAGLESSLGSTASLLSSDDNSDNGVSGLKKSFDIRTLRDQVMKVNSISQDRADAMVASAFNLTGFNLEYLMQGDFGAWSVARAKAEENDTKNNLPKGTTEKFIRNLPMGKYDTSSLSDDEVRLMATKINISEAAVKTFIAVRDGQDNPAINKIYFVDYNRFTQNNDTADLCQQAAIPNGSYVYYDKAGLHTFTSYAMANEYRKANPDKELDYMAEISNAVYFALNKAATGGDGAAKTVLDQLGGDPTNTLKNFLSNKSSQSIFGNTNDNLMQLLNMADVIYRLTGVTSNITSKLFSRSNATAGGMPVDYLKTAGVQMLKNLALSYLNDAMGIYLGPAELTPDDLFDMFNGNSSQVLTRIGGSILDNELSVQKGTFEGIFEATNSAQRQCAMERAALQLIGNAINIPNLRLDGSLLDNFGGGKIEHLLSLPDKSFHGKNISDLLNYVPVSDFVRGFSIPVSAKSNSLADAALLQMGQDIYAQNKGQPVYQKIKTVEAYFSGLDASLISGSSVSGFLEAAAAMEAQLLADINTVRGSPALLTPASADTNVIIGALKGKGGFASNSDEELRQMISDFQAKLLTIDTALQLDTGTTAKLLQDQITPDSYRSLANTRAIENMAGDVVLTFLGIDTTKITTARIRNVINIIEGSKNLSSMSAANRLEIYSFLKDIFSLNLDKKAGFTEGTFAEIVANPGNASSILLREGARRFDQQFELDGTNGGPSMEGFINAVFNNDVIKQTCASYTKSPVDPKDLTLANASQTSQQFSDCMNTERIVAATMYGINAIAFEASNKIASFLTDISGVDVTVQHMVGGKPVPVTSHQLGIVVPQADILGLFRGDFRVLAVISMVKGVSSIIGDQNGMLAVPANFAINYQDVYTAVYSNAALEDQYAARARAYAIANITGTNDAANLNPDPFDRANYSLTSGAVIDTMVAEMPISAGATTTVTPPEILPTDSPEVITAKQIQIRQAGMILTAANNAEATARANFKNYFQKELEYKTADCALYKLDPLIPRGFAKAMYEGNGYVRTTYFLNYLDNWIRKDGPSWYNLLPEGTLPAIRDFVEGKIDRGQMFDILATGSVLNKFDDFLVSNSPTVFGMSLQPGTAAALYAFIREGNINSDHVVKIGSQQITFKSITSLYSTDWIAGHLSNFVDQKLHLPTGTSYQIYSAYVGLKHAKDLATAWSAVYELDGTLFNAEGLVKNGVDVEKMKQSADYLKDKNAYIASQKAQSNAAISQIKAQVVSFIVTTVFSKQLLDFDKSLGLVPGSSALLVSTILTKLIAGTSMTVGLVMFVLLNLFGVYKVEYQCTADGYYPAMESPPDPSVWDNGGLGTFDGMNKDVREKKYIEAAQYKAQTLVSDMLAAGARSGDPTLVPTQIMTGRVEDVTPFTQQVQDTICKKVGSSSLMANTAVCSGWRSRAGLWQNPQTTTYTHIGF